MFKRKKTVAPVPATKKTYNSNRAAQEVAPAKEPRLKVIRDAYKVTKGVKPWIGFALLGIFLVVWVAVISLGLTWGHPVYAGFVGLPLAVLATLFFFTRQAGTAAYAAIKIKKGLEQACSWPFEKAGLLPQR